MADGAISLRELASAGAVRSWAAPYFHISRVPPANGDPAVTLAKTIVQVLNPARGETVQATVLFWHEGQRLEDLTATLTIPGQSMRDHRPFRSEGSTAGWISVGANLPIIPGGWIEQLVPVGGMHQVVRVPLRFQPRALE